MMMYMQVRRDVGGYFQESLVINALLFAYIGYLFPRSVFVQAAFLGVDYWMHPVLAEDSQGNVKVPLDELREILEATLGQP